MFSSFSHRSVVAIVAFPAVACHGWATITFNVDAAYLGTAGGTNWMPRSGLVLLVGSTQDKNFGAPTVEAFTTGDDRVLFRAALESGWGDGIFQRTIVVNLELFPGLQPGDPVQLCWFPTLTVDATQPVAGAPYGTYRHASGLDGSAAWIIPGEGALVDLKFLTEAVGGSNADMIGRADRIVGEPRIHLASPVMLPSGEFQFKVQADSGAVVFIEASTNLATWEPVITLTNGTGSIQFNDGSATNRLRRFYRARI